MRIRKRSLDVLSSSSWEKANGFPQIGHCDDGEKASKEREFLLPLFAAVMEAESQLPGDAPPQPVSREVPETRIGIGAHARPLHNWKNALLRYNTNDEKLQLGEEGKKADDRCNAIMSKNRADKFRILTSEAACTTENAKASSVEKQEISGIETERESQKSGRNEKSLLSIYRQLGDDAVKKKRSKQYHCLTHSDGGGKIGIKRTIKGTMEQHISMTKYEAQDDDDDEDDDDDNGNNNHRGSRCRRRNGRGWQCSQRTLVGYSLCEHHLGKGRFKSVNTSISPGPVVTGNKGSKVKQLHLIHAAYNVNLP